MVYKSDNGLQPATGRIKVKLVKSLIGRLKKHKATALGLGLKKLHQQVELEDSPSVRGMINKIAYLLKIGD